jgi:hypothetical protein
VRLLDGLVRYRFGDDAELMTAWASARNVLGPFRSKAEPGAETPGIVKPAAWWPSEGGTEARWVEVACRALLFNPKSRGESVPAPPAKDRRNASRARVSCR